VAPPREQSQHPRRVGRIGRLAENRTINHNDGVGPENKIPQSLLVNRDSLFPRQPLCTIFRALSRQRSLVNICRLHRERNFGVAQQFLTPGRSGGQNQHAFRF
jgi:hypothetical protein